MFLVIEMKYCSSSMHQVKHFRKYGSFKTFSSPQFFYKVVWNYYAMAAKISENPNWSFSAHDELVVCLGLFDILYCIFSS